MSDRTIGYRMDRLRSWAGKALDLIYPGVCHLCGDGVADGRSLCDRCGEGLPGLEAPFCSDCGESFDGAIDAVFSCPNCRDQQFAFEFARPALVRSEGAMQMVQDLKYGRRLELAHELAGLATRAFSDPRLDEAVAARWPLIPVPLHRRREHWRQFNQSFEIARPLGQMLDLPVLDALKRTRATVTQTRLSRSQRQQNLRGAFEVRPDSPEIPGAILLDDVFTTGSTAHECARVLRRTGTQKVVVVTVVRG